VETVRKGDIFLHIEKLPHVETAAVAFLVRVGSANEGDPKAGISHFLEHIVFRGTEKYSMRELKYTVESVGGTLNAFTGIKSTVYYARIPSFQLEKTVEVLQQIVLHPLIRNEDVEIERRVILEEIRMSRENPEDRLYKMTLMNVWGNPYGRDTLGSEDTVSRITPDDLKKYHAEKYSPKRIKVVMAGKISDDILRTIEETHGDDFEDPPEPSFKHIDDVKLETMRDINHVHVLLVKEGVGKMDEDYEKMLVLDTMLGSGMSSYLFEEIREKLGTVYEIYSFPISLRTTGIYGIYFSTSPENVESTLQKLVDSLKKFDSDGYFDYGVKRRLGKFEMSLESPGGFVNYMVDRLTYSDEVETPAEYENRIRSITQKEIKDFSQKFLSGEWSVFAVAPDGFSWNISRVEI
jgi:predicted Zn-dependent peptidase